MRRSAALVLTGFIAVAVLSGCKNTDDATSDLPRPSRAFCEAAASYDKRVTTAGMKLPEHIRRVTAISENAPKDVAKDAQLFLDALKKRAAGDTSVVDNPEIQGAIDRINRRAGQDCGWYQRQGM